MFLAHESNGLATLEEYASGEAYEGRRDLGNTQPVDGVRFKGRGDPAHRPEQLRPVRGAALGGPGSGWATSGRG